MPASRCCSAVGATGFGLAGLGSGELGGSEVEAGVEFEGTFPEVLGVDGGFGDEDGLEDREGLEGGGMGSVGELETAGGVAIGVSRVGPQLAASKKKTTRKAAAALRMFHPQRSPQQPSGRAVKRFGGIQTNLGRSCGGGGSRLPTS